MMLFRFIPTVCSAIGIAFAVSVLCGELVAKDGSAASSVEVSEADEIRQKGWTDQQVARWAYHHAPLANLLEAERVAVAKQVSLKSEKDRAGVGLIQAVLRELALHQRNEAAAEALGAYYRGVGTNALLGPLRKIAPELEELQHLAEIAGKLDLPNGDPYLLEDQRLQYEDQWFQLVFGLRRIKGHLIQLTAQIDEPNTEYVLISPMPSDFSGCTENVLDFLLEHDIELLVKQAMTNRKDLSAIRVLCECMNENSLPAARKLLGGFIPGGGDLLGSASGGFLSLLHPCEDDDLAERRAQCRQLFRYRKREIESEVRDAVLALKANQARLGVVTSRLQNKALEKERIAQGAVHDLRAPGAVQQSQIQVFQLEAEKIMLEQAVAESVVALRRAVGCVLDLQSPAEKPSL